MPDIKVTEKDFDAHERRSLNDGAPASTAAEDIAIEELWDTIDRSLIKASTDGGHLVAFYYTVKAVLTAFVRECDRRELATPEAVYEIMRDIMKDANKSYD